MLIPAGGGDGRGRGVSSQEGMLIPAGGGEGRGRGVSSQEGMLILTLGGVGEGGMSRRSLASWVLWPLWGEGRPAGWPGFGGKWGKQSLPAQMKANSLAFLRQFNSLSFALNPAFVSK